MGFKTAREMRDLLVPELKSAAELTLMAGYATVDAERCSRCGVCIEIGHCNAITMTDEAAVIDPKLCKACSTCIDMCGKQAIRMVEAK